MLSEKYRVFTIEGGGNRMNSPYSKEEKNKKGTNLQQSEYTSSADREEQAMNGLYGMLESNVEERDSEDK